MANQIVQLPGQDLAPTARVDAAASLPVPPTIAIATAPPAMRWEPPILGCLAMIFGVTALFKATIVLAPLGLAFALAAGLARQFAWAAVGGIAAVVALLISPVFWALLGIAWLIERLGWLWSWLT